MDPVAVLESKSGAQEKVGEPTNVCLAW